jgi:DNA polymerase sigma
VQAFGSFTMDLFTPKSDLDLSVNFSADTEDQCPRNKKIKVIRKFSKVLYSLQSNNYFLEQNIFTCSLAFCASIYLFQ